MIVNGLEVVEERLLRSFMKRLFGQTQTGIIIIAVGLLFYGTWILWNVLLVGHPVSMPVSLAVGNVRTPEFRLNVNRYFIVEVVAKKHLPLDILDCMMGISTGPLDPNNCKEGEVPLLQASWTLWSDGRIVNQGSSEDDKGSGGWTQDEVERDIGVFRGEHGRKYVLDVTFTKDGRALAVTDPHLEVEVAGSYYEDEMVEDYVLSLLFFVIETLGVFLLISSYIKRKRNRMPDEGSARSQ
jgi:hypothetical protein